MEAELAYLLCQGWIGDHHSLARVVPLPVDGPKRHGVLLLKSVLGQRAEEAQVTRDEAASSRGGQLSNGEPVHRQPY